MQNTNVKSKKTKQHYDELIIHETPTSAQQGEKKVKNAAKRRRTSTTGSLVELLCDGGQVRRVLFSMICPRARVMLSWWCVRFADTLDRIIRVKQTFTNAYCACATEAQRKCVQMHYIKMSNLMFDNYEGRVDDTDEGGA